VPKRDKSVSDYYITGVDGLKKGFERIVWNAESTASFDGAQATVIDPIVDDLAGHMEMRSNIVGGEVIGSHHRSPLLDYNKYGPIIIAQREFVKTMIIIKRYRE
jgi:hypothetical protein